MKDTIESAIAMFVPVIGDSSQLIYSPFHLRVHVGYSSSPSRLYAAARKSPPHEVGMPPRLTYSFVLFRHRV